MIPGRGKTFSSSPKFPDGLRGPPSPPPPDSIGTLSSVVKQLVGRQAYHSPPRSAEQRISGAVPTVCLYGVWRGNFTFNIEILPNNLHKNCGGIITNSLEVKWVPKSKK
jgi:hypothetical protein